MKRVLKVLGLIGFTFFLFVAVAAIAFYHLVQTGELRRFLINEIEQKTELNVQVGEADLQVGSILGIAFRDVALSQPEASEPAITAQRVTARVELLPLLKRKLIFYEIRLHRPAARIIRDEKGQILLLEKLAKLPFLKQEQGEITLDLHVVRIESGEVDFQDHRADPTETVHFTDLDLKLERIRGKRFRDFVLGLMKFTRYEPQGPAVEFDLSTIVEKESRRAPFQAKGKMVLPQEELDFRSAWWSAEIRAADLPAEIIQRYTGSYLPMKSATGLFSPRLTLQGNWAERLRLNGDVSFRRLAVEAPDIFSAPLSPGDGHVQLEVAWSRQRMEFPRLDFRSKEMNLVVRGDLRSAGENDPYLELTLSSPLLPVAVVRKYLPLRKIGWEQLESFAASLQDGELEIKKAEVSGSLSEIRQLTNNGLRDRVRLSAELRNISIPQTGDGYLPVRGLQGRMTFEKGVLSLSEIKCSYGQSRLTDVTGTYWVSASAQRVFEFRARGELDLSDLRGQLKLPIVPDPLTELASNIQEMGGKGQMDLAVRRPADAPLQIDGKIALDSAAVTVGEYPLSELNGDLALTPKEIRVEDVTGLLSGSPVQIQLGVRNYGTDQATFDLGVDSTGMKAGVVTRLLLPSGSLEDPGIVRGSVRYQGSVATKADRNFSGDLELVNVQLVLRPLLQPLRELNGKVRIANGGVEFQAMKGLLVGSAFDFTGRWSHVQKPQLTFAFDAQLLDINYLLTQVDPEASEFYANLQAEGKINIHQGRLKAFEFVDLTSDVVLDRRTWRFSNLAARSAGGVIQGTAIIADKPETLAFSVEPKIQAVPVQGFLNWFEATTTEMTGKVNLSGNLESVGKDGAERKGNLNGALKLRIEDGTIFRMRILVRLLSLLDLTRWFTLRMPDLGTQGIRFRTITGDFSVTKGVLSTENLLVDGDELRMTGAGKVDLTRDEIDFVVAVRPFPAIDTAIKFIPLIGRGIAAIKNSLLVASFHISGPVEDPAITPAPLSTLSEVFFGVLGIPKNIIGLADEEKKENPNE
jgi:hypothetical protein